MSFKKNTAVTGLPFLLVSATDGSAITAGTPVVYVTLDGGAQATVAGAAVHEGNGQWSVSLTAAEMNGDIVGILFTHASAINVHFTIKTDTKIVSELQDFNSAVDTVATVTTLTNLPAITANWITAAGINAAALNGKGDWNIDKTGYSITALPAISADWLTAAGTAPDFTTEIQAGLATPTNITAATGIVLSGVTHTGAVIPTVTTLTNLPAITAGWLTATGIAASALDGKGNWNIGKTAYTLSQAFPTNFADLAITVTSGEILLPTIPANWITAAGINASALDGKGNWNIGKTGYTASTVSDKTGYSISGTKQTLDALTDVTSAQVNAEVVDVLFTDTDAEPAQGAPAATASLATKIGYLYKMLRNKKTANATTISVYDDAGTTVDHKRTISDDATTYTEEEIVTGP